MWLVPSRRRITKLRNFLHSAIDAETSTPGIVIVDNQDYMDNRAAYDRMEMPPGWKFVMTEAVGMGPKIRQVWDAHVKGGLWVGILNDDHFIVTKGWDVRLINQLNGKNFLTCNDRWNAPQRAAGATVFSMPLMEAFGFPMFPEGIDHLGIDDVFETIGKNTGCWEVDMSVIVEHHHAFKNPDLVDETHKAVYSGQPWQDNTGKLSPVAAATHAAFQKWVNEEATKVVGRVRELRKSEALNELPFKNKTVPVSRSGSEVLGGEASRVSVRRDGDREVSAGDKGLRLEKSEDDTSHLPGCGAV